MANETHELNKFYSHIWIIAFISYDTIVWQAIAGQIFQDYFFDLYIVKGVPMYFVQFF
jgi:hypothetical protein